MPIHRAARRCRPVRLVRPLRRATALPASVAALLVALLVPVIGLGDDTDIYAPPLDAGFKPTVMFMVDTSNSMDLADFGGYYPRRRDRLLGPLIDYLSTAKDLRVGLSTFNGLSRGGAVVHPAEDLDHDVCPDGGCSSVTVRAPVLRSSDDGSTVPGRSTDLAQIFVTVGQTLDDTGYRYYHLKHPGMAALGQTVVETPAAGVVAAEALPLFRSEDGERTRIGYHFPDVELPPDVDVYHVSLLGGWAGNGYLDPAAGEGSGTAKVRITLDSRTDSPPLANAPGQRVSDRPRTPDHVDWDVRRPGNWESLGSDTSHFYRTSNFATLFNRVRPAGTRGPVTVLMEPAPGASFDKIDTVMMLGLNERSRSPQNPTLLVYWKDPNMVRPTFKTGLRFDRLNVPRGARVSAAHVELTPYRNSDNALDLSIRAESSGDARPFQHGADDVGSRTLTGNAVRWQPGPWQREKRTRSPDIAAVVQQVVSRDDWCAGNALALQLEGEGERKIYLHDFGELWAPSLHVTYETGSVDAADACRQESGSDALQLASEGDAVDAPSGTPMQAPPVYDTGAASGRLLGMRFRDVGLGPDDEIAEASLVLSVPDVTPTGWQRIALEASIDSDTAEAPFDSPDSLASRVAGEPTVRWVSDQLAPGSGMASIDLAPLVRRALADPGWRRGGDIVLTLRRTGWHHVGIATSHATEVPGPSLRIVRRLRGAAAAALPLRTARDVLIERLQTLPAVGETPVVDAFFETAQYLTGGEVVHGRRRGEQRPDNALHRLSDPASYTGGSIARPAGCPADDPGAAACADETIDGAPVYIAPPSSECRANQIVLVTDGDPSTSPADTAARIRTLTGGAFCDAAPDSQACATDLARWLNAGGPDRAPVTVNTIGFAFESDFLKAVAREGGGRAFTASSASKLSEALQGIGQAVEHEGATLVGPAVSVSQFNRSTHRDDVYLGLFEPADTGPLWPGNLKRYALGPLPGGKGFGLLDAEGDAAIDPDTGRFSPQARSFWSDTPDGAAVPAGGATSRLSAIRRVLTWPAASDGEHHGARALVDFNKGNGAILASDLGVDEAARTEAIRWMRGLDVRDEDGDGVTDEARRRMGAAIHTTPTVIDYASNDPDGRSVVYAGTQEGFLHGVDTATGHELFAFLPFELYGQVGAFMNPAPGPMRYGLDGPVTSWTSDENGNGRVDPGEKAYLTVGMRRGGEHYYTLDVSDPDNPSIAWTIDPSRAGFEAVRQTWSAMREVRLRADPETTPDGAAVRPALVFANGYDPRNDDRTAGRSRWSRRQPGGGSIYLIDPHTGALLHDIKSRRMWYSIPSDVAVVDTDMNGITDLLLVGDLSAQLWRVDLVPSLDDNGAFVETVPAASFAWHLTNHSTAARQIATGDAPDRRFFHPPDVALMSDGSGPPSLKVAIGSGRRDHPLETSTQDRLYMLTLGASPDDIFREEHMLYDATATPGIPPANKQGWFVDLQRPGEKILGTPIIVDARVLVTSYVPPAGGADPCEPKLGGGRFHGLDAFTAAPALAGRRPQDGPVRSIELDTPGIPPSVTVVISAARPDVPAVIAGTQSVEALGPMRYRRQTYWITD